MRKCVLAALALLVSLPAMAADSVVTYHNSIFRAGAYKVPTLTLAAAANVHLDTAFKPTVTGNIYAQPLYYMASGSTHGIVIVTTESNAVYALDAGSGKTAWKAQLPASVPLSQLPCGNINPEGITGTSVIDPAAGVLYVDALIQTGNGPRQMIYALLLTNGSVVANWPLDVQASMATAGVTFSSSTQGERSALLLFGGNLYVVYGGRYGDCGTYHGTVIQIQTQPPKLLANWETRANGGGIWAQGGIAGDGDSLFVTTGNTMGASTWEDGEAIIRLRAGLARSTNTKDYFTPSNWKDLDNSDADLGGTEALPISIPVTGSEPAKRVIAFGKDGNAYLANRTNLGGIGGAIQVLQASSGAIRTAPAVYQGTSATMVAYTNSGNSRCSYNNVAMLNVAASGTSPMSLAWCESLNGGGAPIVTTTDGTTNAMVWVLGAEGDNQLHGFNALTGASVFSGVTMSGLHHFQTILATKKRFYVAGDNEVYSLEF
jgi:PQQ enzyme-like repeat protein